MIREEEVFKIGQFAKPHGIKGELSLVTNSDVLEDAEDPYIVCEMDGILVPFFVEDFRYKTDTVVLVKLEDVNSEEDARMFVGKEVFYPLDAVHARLRIDHQDLFRCHRNIRKGCKLRNILQEIKVRHAATPSCCIFVKCLLIF